MKATLRFCVMFVWSGVLLPLGIDVTEAAAATKNVSTTAQLVSAIATAQPGDVIVLAPGVYQPSNTLDVDVDVTIQGGGSASSVIDGDGDDILYVRANNARVENLTLRNGRAAIIWDGRGTFVIRRVTITANTGTGVTSDGGGQVVVVNSTIANNVNTEGFGSPASGIKMSCASLSLDHVTISGNDRGLHLNFPCGDSFFAINALITKNGEDCVARGGYTLSAASSLDSDGTCRAAENSGTSGFATVTNPGLGSLADNGGPTMTMALSATSPAVNAGSLCTEPFDQRGANRDADCDIGAYERASSVTMTSATGAGAVTLVTNGVFLDFLAVPEAAMPNQSGKPTGVTFPYGFFRWLIGVPAPGDIAVVDMIFPAAVPTPPQYWKVIDGVWTDVCLQLSCTVGGNRLTMIFRDGDFGDLDEIANAVVFDPGGLGSGGDIDATAPEIAIATPADGAVYLLNAAVASAYECSDAGSGIATCAGPVPSGTNVPTNAVGATTFSVNARDQAGNTASASARYTVTFGTCLLYDPTLAKMSGSTYPIRLQLCDGHGRNVSSPSIELRATSLTQTSTTVGSALNDSGSANPDFDFRYDASLGGYVFNLKTTGLTTGTYNLHFTAGSDPLVHSAPFAIR